MRLVRDHKDRCSVLVLCVALALASVASADDPEDELGTWLGATSNLRYTDEWSLFLQGELRTWEMLSNLNETLFRVAGHYDFNPKVMGAFGTKSSDSEPSPTRTKRPLSPSALCRARRAGASSRMRPWSFTG